MEKVYMIKGTEKQIKEFDKLFGYIEFLGIIGHSATFSVFVDGDGRSRIKVRDRFGEEVCEVDKIKDIMNSHYDVKNSFCFD